MRADCAAASWPASCEPCLELEGAVALARRGPSGGTSRSPRELRVRRLHLRRPRRAPCARNASRARSRSRKYSSFSSGVPFGGAGSRGHSSRTWNGSRAGAAGFTRRAGCGALRAGTGGRHGGGAPPAAAAGEARARDVRRRGRGRRRADAGEARARPRAATWPESTRCSAGGRVARVRGARRPSGRGAAGGERAAAAGPAGPRGGARRRGASRSATSNGLREVVVGAGARRAVRLDRGVGRLGRVEDERHRRERPLQPVAHREAAHVGQLGREEDEVGRGLLAALERRLARLHARSTEKPRGPKARRISSASAASGSTRSTWRAIAGGIVPPIPRRARNRRGFDIDGSAVTIGAHAHLVAHRSRRTPPSPRSGPPSSSTLGASGVEVRDGEGTPMPGTPLPPRRARRSSSRGSPRAGRPRRRARAHGGALAEVPDEDWGEGWKKDFAAARRRARARPAVLDRRAAAAGRGRGGARSRHGVRHRDPPDDLALPRRALGPARGAPGRDRCSTSAPGPGSSPSRRASSAPGASRRTTTTRSPSRSRARTRRGTASTLELTGRARRRDRRDLRRRRREHPRERARRARAGARRASSRPGGVLLLSGILGPQEDEVRRAYVAAGLAPARGRRPARRRVEPPRARRPA